MDLVKCCEIIDSIPGAATLEDVHIVCKNLCEHLGFDYFFYCAKLPALSMKSRVLVIDGYPPEWRERYVARGYISIDPMISYCFKSSVPLPWDELGRVEKMNKAELEFMRECGDYGLRSGVSFPLQKSHGECAMLSLASGEVHMQSRIAEAIPFAHLVFLHIHEAVRRIEKVTANFENYRLSEREMECLRWATDGKTSWETSKILGISERTVIFHLQNVFGKLEVTNKLQAVARAVSLGLIDPLRS
ncbi:MAG TPA: LuxR family transcriptional regulator [Geobacteraceae bacterium]